MFKCIFKNEKIYKTLLLLLIYFNMKFIIKYIVHIQNINYIRIINSFRRKNFSQKRVLIVEANNCHGETLASVYKYFKDLGFSVDLLLNKEQITNKCVDSIKIPKNSLFFFPVKLLVKILQAPSCISKYNYIFFNSYHVYFKKINGNLMNIFELSNPFLSKNSNFCGYVHHIEEYDNCKNFQPFMLANMRNESTKDFKVLNPHYFGEYKPHKKNKKTRFIMVGAIEAERRNCNLLIDAVKELHLKGIKDFKIVVIGRGNLENIPQNIRKYIDIKGRLNYPDMYKEMQKADYFLPLLDPTNPEHDRYLTSGTSGSFQLIYGFLTPCIIQEKFSTLHGFNKENSFIYKQNEDLAKAMQMAISQSNTDYESMKINLKKYANNLYKISLKELSNYIGENNDIRLQ